MKRTSRWTRLRRRSRPAVTIAEDTTQQLGASPHVSRNASLWLVAAGSVAACLMMGHRAVAATLAPGGEVHCQQAMARGLGRFVVALAKCVMRCEAGARAGDNPVSDFRPPYARATAACVQEAEAKASGNDRATLRPGVPALLPRRRL
jgi:hypothetical protein